MYAAAYLLSSFGYELETDQQELEDFAVSVAASGIEIGDMAVWFENHALKR